MEYLDPSKYADDRYFFDLVRDPVKERREKNYARTDEEAMILKKLDQDLAILSDDDEINNVFIEAMKKLGGCPS